MQSLNDLGPATSGVVINITSNYSSQSPFKHQISSSKLNSIGAYFKNCYANLWLDIVFTNVLQVLILMSW